MILLCAMSSDLRPLVSKAVQPTTRSRAWLKIGASIALMGVLLWWFLRSADLGEVAAVLMAADPVALIAAVALALGSYALRALRWGVILRPVGSVRLSSLLLTTAVGYGAMALLPSRMVDLIRPVLLARRDRLPLSATLASIVTERLFDLWSVVVFFLIFVFVPPPLVQPPPWLDTLTQTGWFLAAGLAIGTAILIGLFRFQEAFIRTLSWPFAKLLPRLQGPVESFFGHFLDGLRIVQRGRDLIVVVALTLVTWLMVFWQLKMTLLAFDISLPFRGTFVLVALTVIGLAIPTPGGAGGFHQALSLGLEGLFGVARTMAVAAAIAYHAICFLPITLIGVACIPALGLGRRVNDGSEGSGSAKR
jgi:hypothetical protein